MAKGFHLRCAAGKTARVWVQGKGGALKRGQALVLLPRKGDEGGGAAAGFVAPLRQTLIDRNGGHVNVIVCQADYRALRRGIEHLSPGLQ